MAEKQKTSDSEFRELVRLLDKDIKGSFSIYDSIRKIKGCGFMIANVICKTIELEKSRKIGSIPPEELKQIEKIIQSIEKQEIPNWLLNRRKDNDTGEDKHLISSDLDLSRKFDIQFLKKIKSFRGYRHSRGDKGHKIKARGQRTRGTGRQKGKTVGVSKKKQEQAKKA